MLFTTTPVLVLKRFLKLIGAGLLDSEDVTSFRNLVLHARSIVGVPFLPEVGGLALIHFRSFQRRARRRALLGHLALAAEPMVGELLPHVDREGVREIFHVAIAALRDAARDVNVFPGHLR